MDWLGGTRSARATEQVIGLGGYGKTLSVLTCPSVRDETFGSSHQGPLHVGVVLAIYRTGGSDLLAQVGCWRDVGQLGRRAIRTSAPLRRGLSFF
jgi:hypothetical protein